MMLTTFKVLKYSFIVLIAISFFNCKKDDGTPSVSNDNKVDVRDSAYYYSLIYYLWNQNLPDYSKWSTSQNGDLISNSSTVFKPHSFANVDSIMESSSGIRNYSDVGKNGKKEDRYSFASLQTDWESTSSGSNVGYGFSRGYLTDNDLRVVYVFKSSPIGKAGVKRGWKIVSINGITANKTNDQSLQNSLSSNNTSTFVFQLQDNSVKTLKITKAAYTADFVLADTIITVNTQKIGLIAFYSFLGDNNGQTTVDELKDIVTDFSNKGVTDVVVDLRYNGGGYVSVSEDFANLLAPSTAKGKTMYTTKYNQILTDYYNSINETSVTKFDNSSSLLNLSRIVFITSGGTASASELLINNLKPYMTVKLIGSKTYGKPVGFPGLLIQMSKTDKSQNYYVFPIAFQTVNANNEGGYFSGIDVDKQEDDDFSHDFVDPNEANFKQAISYLTTGIFARTSQFNNSRKSIGLPISQENLGGVNALIDNRKARIR